MPLGAKAREADPSATPPADGAQAAFEEFDEFAREAPARDPLRRYNRLMFNFNDKAYFWVFRPLAVGYGKTVPEGVRKSVQRGLNNLEFPVRFLNCGLQGKFRKAGREAGRFTVNTTVGLLGLFDPARSWLHMEPAEEDFGQTLGRYGVGPGWPLVLPFLGQSNVRDGLGMIPDQFLKPGAYVACMKPVAGMNPTELGVGVWCYDKVNYVSLNIGLYESLKKDALDPYTMMRDAYGRMREARIRE